jgi:cytoskeleton protein RodZ
MTEDKDRPDADSPEATAEGPICGERLAEARRAKQISVLEIAKELNVEEAKIRALENNDFELLGAPVFAKGHLKKYSQLVGVDLDDVLADYYRLTRSQEVPLVVVERKKPRRELTPGPWIGVSLVLLLLVLAYWLIAERPFETPPASTVRAPAESDAAPVPDAGQAEPEVAPTPEVEQADVEVTPAAGTYAEEAADAAPEGEAADVTEPAESSAPVALPAQPPAEEPVAPAAGAQQDLLAAAEDTTAPDAGSDDVRLSVTFLGDCWTEITDASGRRLFFQLGRSGRTINVSGAAPLSVLFGDADNVDIRVDGEEFDIPAANRRGRTARLTISGS